MSQRTWTIHTPFVFTVLTVVSLIIAGAFETWAMEYNHDVPQPIQELFQTEAVYPQQEGELQFTLLPPYRNSPTREKVEIPMSMEFGITDAWQIEVGWTTLQLVTEPTQVGIGNLELGTL